MAMLRQLSCRPVREASTSKTKSRPHSTLGGTSPRVRGCRAAVEMSSFDRSFSAQNGPFYLFGRVRHIISKLVVGNLVVAFRRHCFSSGRPLISHIFALSCERRGFYPRCSLRESANSALH